MCAAEVAAAITWGAVPLGEVLQTPCGNVDPKLMGSMSMVKRTCSQEGVWGELDFSKCTLSRRANPFLLVWFAVQGESLLSMEAVMQLKQEVRYHRFSPTVTFSYIQTYVVTYSTASVFAPRVLQTLRDEIISMILCCIQK